MTLLHVCQPATENPWYTKLCRMWKRCLETYKCNIDCNANQCHSSAFPIISYFSDLPSFKGELNSLFARWLRLLSALYNFFNSLHFLSMVKSLLWQDSQTHPFNTLKSMYFKISCLKLSLFCIKWYFWNADLQIKHSTDSNLSGVIK